LSAGSGGLNSISRSFNYRSAQMFNRAKVESKDHYFLLLPFAFLKVTAFGKRLGDKALAG
jgi:hypothetical protein